MSICNIAIAMNYIDDSLVKEAGEYEVQQHRKQTNHWKYVGVAATWTLLFVGSLLCAVNKKESSNIGIFPDHFHYEGGFYLTDGKLEYMLPQDYKYVGKIRPTEKYGEKEVPGNFDSNILLGEVYMSETDSTIAYFRWKDREKEGDENKRPYIVFYLYSEN